MFSNIVASRYVVRRATNADNGIGTSMRGRWRQASARSSPRIHRGPWCVAPRSLVAEGGWAAMQRVWRSHHASAVRRHWTRTFTSHRVVSVLPSATETLCAIDGGHLLVGRSHEVPSATLRRRTTASIAAAVATTPPPSPSSSSSPSPPPPPPPPSCRTTTRPKLGSRASPSSPAN